MVALARTVDGIDLLLRQQRLDAFRRERAGDVLVTNGDVLDLARMQ